MSSKIFESTGDSHSNFPRPVGKVISEYARKAYTYSNIRESDQNYIIVDFVFMGYDQNNGFINQEHTFIVFDNFGTEIARIEHIENFISDPVITHRGRYFTYLINNDTENLNRLIVLDLISKKELFNSDKDEPRFTFGEPRTLSKDQNSVAPYIDTDSCYVMLEVHRKGPDIMSQCDIIPFYLDIENRINYFGCCAKLDWGKWNFPSQHYKIIEQSSANSKKF